MKIAIITCLTFVSMTGLALTKTINCKSPEELVGSFAKVEGTLTYKKIDEAQLAGPYEAKGTLKIKTSRGLNVVEVKGQYDKGDSEYAHLSPVSEKVEISAIYLDFKDGNADPKSYIEYTDLNGTILKVKCGK